MKCLCQIPTADLRVYTIHTTTIPVPVTCWEGSCSPNLPWPQNLSTQDCRQPIPTIGTRDEILCFGQDSVNELDLLRKTQQRLPFCFGSSRTSNAQAKFTRNRLLPGYWGAETTGYPWVPSEPFACIDAIDCSVNIESVPVLSWLPLCGMCFGSPTFFGNSDVCLLMWLLPTVAQPSVIPATPHLPTFEAVSV